MAISESKEIIKELNSKSLDLNKEEFEKILKSNINDNYFILTTRRIAWSYFQSESFESVAKFKRCESDSNTVEDGYLITYKYKIPIVYTSEVVPGSILLINKTKFGKLIKLRPKPILDFNSVEVLDEGLSINIIDYTSNKAFKEKILTNSNDFLKSKGTKKEQDNYLKEMVYVNVSERLILDLSDEAEVYSLIISNANSK